MKHHGRKGNRSSSSSSRSSSRSSSSSSSRSRSRSLQKCHKKERKMKKMMKMMGWMNMMKNCMGGMGMPMMPMPGMMDMKMGRNNMERGGMMRQQGMCPPMDMGMKCDKKFMKKMWEGNCDRPMMDCDKGMMGMHCDPRMMYEKRMKMQCDPMMKSWKKMMKHCPQMMGMGCDPRMMKDMKKMKCHEMMGMGMNNCNMGPMFNQCPPMNYGMEWNPMMMKCMKKMMKYPEMMGMCNPMMCGPMMGMGMNCHPMMWMHMMNMMSCNPMMMNGMQNMMKCNMKERRGRDMQCRKQRYNRRQRCPIPKQARRAFALADKFGDQPEKYRKFVDQTKDKNFCDVMKLWKQTNKQCQDACIQKRAGKLAYICKDTTQNMMEVVKKNPQMGFKDMLKMVCKDKGIKLQCSDSDSGHSNSHFDSERQDKRCKNKRMRCEMKQVWPKESKKCDNDNVWKNTWNETPQGQHAKPPTK